MTARPTPEWLVERLAAGELSEEAAASVRARLEAEGRSPAEVLAALDASNREILEQVPPGLTLARIRARAQKPARGGFFAAGLVLVGATAALALVATRKPLEVTQTDDDPTTIKGRKYEPRLLVYRQTANGHERLQDGNKAAPGDRLQLAYLTASEQWGVLVSLDGAGKVGVHLPPAGSTRAAPLEPAREVLLPFGYRLDQAPGFERFFLVTSSQPFSPADALVAARSLYAHGAGRTGALPLPAGLRQTSFLILKPTGGTP